MEKIFRRVWLYVGHESLVPNPATTTAPTSRASRWC